ncbi:MAG: signal peptidase I [Planctomycetota bacterium]
MSEDGDQGPPARRAAHAVRDHAEAILIALVMALVLKQFCVEAFTIPTSSMHPTLIGENQAPDGVGDRILVDKFANWLRDPRRWEIWVFRFPLDRSRNFIKRVVGLPGDHLKIGSEDGDIWVAKSADAPYEIARKPRRVRESLYRPVYPPDAAGERDKEMSFDGGSEGLGIASRWFRVEGDAPDAFRLDALDRFEYRGGTTATLVARNPILTSTDPDTWNQSWRNGTPARDIRVRARLVPTQDRESTVPPSEVRIAWRPDGYYEYRLTLGSTPGSSTARILVEDAVLREVRLDAVWDGRHARTVELEAVDGDLRVHVDGRELAVLPDGRPFRRRHAQVAQRLAIQATGTPFALAGLHIDRDIAYQSSWSPRGSGAEDGVALPAGQYLMIGDNQGDVGNRSEGSYDGRKWELTTVTLRDGTVIRYDENKPLDREGDPETGETWYVVSDADGVERRWRPQDEDPDVPETTDWTPFVGRELFVGRAFLVFWPAWPDPPGRFRRVR